jgi:hypothetical protein
VRAVTTSSSFIALAGAAFLVLVGVLVVSTLIGLQRRRAGFQLSADIERAAGMEGRWRARERAAAAGAKATAKAKGDNAAA